VSLALHPPVSQKASEVARHGGIAPTRWDRTANDAYFTIDAPWIIPALLSKVKIQGPVLEPAAGVGHLARELRRGHGLEVVASDLRAYENPLVPDIGICDIWSITSLKDFGFVVTNLPYRDQDKLAAHVVALGARDELQYRFTHPRRMSCRARSPQPRPRAPQLRRRASSDVAAALV
jgi:hypothetical protein